MFEFKRTCALATIVGAVLANGCGGGASFPALPANHPNAGAQSPTPIQSQAPQQSITLTHDPASRSIDSSQSEVLTATVNDDPNNKGVQWTIICPQGVTVCGSMSSVSSASGVPVIYKAPTSIQGSEKVLVTATSAADNTKSTFVFITVNPPPTLINTSPGSLTANVGQSFQASLDGFWFNGGTTPLRYNLKTGTLPNGLNLNPVTGTILGVPKAASSSAPVFTVVDSGNPPIALDLTIPITINPMSPLSITPASGALPIGMLGGVYNKMCGDRNRCHAGVSVVVTGGIEPYLPLRWLPVGGSRLPPGLNLEFMGLGYGGDAMYEISGIPRAAGTFLFRVETSDSESPAQRISATYTISIYQ